MTNLALAIVDAVGGEPLRLPSIELPIDSDGVDVTELLTGAAIAVAAITLAARACSPYTEAEILDHARELLREEKRDSVSGMS